MFKLMLRIKQAKVILLISFFRLFKIFAKDLWVICERGDDARDNGYWMYKYIKQNHPAQKVYYIIDFTSADYEKVSEDAIQLGSLKYYWALAVSSKIISTHYGAGNKYFSHKFFGCSGLGKKFYFLQHGVTKDDMVQFYGDCAPMKLFVCGAKPEYDWIAKNFKHPDGVVRYTGFARFDQLHNAQSKRQVLVMPTWRSYIKTQEQFAESEYYIKWNGLINHPVLLRALKDMNIDLVFYPHYEVQKYITGFRSCSENVVIADFDHFDVQTLLKESAILITDYSSVSFDFAYMRKPVVYYQFDEEKFFSSHYRKGYFDYRTMGFGEVCQNETAVLDEIIKLCSREMQLEDLYSERVSQFFPLFDTRNSERIYEIIAEDRR